MINNEHHNPQNNQDDSSDKRQHTNTESEILEKIAILQLMQKYDIGRTQFNARMRYLQIKTWKVSGKAYLDAEQVAQMDGLHQHIKATGQMSGYPVTLASASVDEKPEQESSMVVAQTQEVEVIPTPTDSPKERLPEKLTQKIRESVQRLVIAPFVYVQSLMSSIQINRMLGSIF